LWKAAPFDAGCLVRAQGAPVVLPTIKIRALGVAARSFDRSYFLV
jgi:hypothetical protein